MKALEQQISDWFVGKRLKEVRLYQGNPGYIILEEERVWAIDGGVELFIEERTFCLGWSQETNQFEFQPSTLKDLSPELETLELDSAKLRSLDHLLGHMVEHIEVQLLSWKDLDDNEGESVLELRLTFQGGGSLQLATVAFDIDQAGMDDLLFDVADHILISVNKVCVIQHPPDESL